MLVIREAQKNQIAEKLHLDPPTGLSVAVDSPVQAGNPAGKSTLVIRKDQLEAIGRRKEAEFATRLTAFLEARYHAQLSVLPREFLAALVQGMLVMAPEWGFKTESDICEISMLLLEIRLSGADDLPGWFDAIVTDESLNAQCKLYRLIGCWESKPGTKEARGASPALS